ncbi:MAG: PqqD family protein [Proteobacteria bacterium]|jgi:hypothetical protein|nr:PqqD family protein [Pseudomonadota bacterium]
MTSSDNTVYTPGTRVAFRKIGDSVVLVNIEDNTMIRLNDTGSEIWACLDGRNVGQIAARICELFEVPAEKALADTREFLEMLHGRGLVEAEGGK